MSVAKPAHGVVTIDPISTPTRERTRPHALPAIARANDASDAVPIAEPKPKPDRKRARAATTTTRPPWLTALAIIAGAAVAGTYLFVTAPPPIDAARATAESATIEIRGIFAILEAENDAARALWTEEIVDRKESGLVFDEHWRDPAVEAGPLPALFLRETARHLERHAPGLRLFLGSRFPINTANRFTGPQDDRFAELEKTGAPQTFFDATTRLETAMFADRAVAQACTSCHNAHADSPKHDWTAGAIMGATTWMYPDAKITPRKANELVGALRASIRAAYRTYLDKLRTFAQPVVIGSRWPRDGRYVPDEDTFMRELERRTSAATLAALLDPDHVPAEIVPGVPPPVASHADTTQQLVVRATRVVRVVVEHAGSRLLVSRLPAGSTTTLRSPPPLRITVGDPASIELEYEGKRIDIPALREPAEDHTIVIPAP